MPPIPWEAAAGKLLLEAAAHRPGPSSACHQTGLASSGSSPIRQSPVAGLHTVAVGMACLNIGCSNVVGKRTRPSSTSSPRPRVKINFAVAAGDMIGGPAAAAALVMCAVAMCRGTLNWADRAPLHWQGLQWHQGCACCASHGVNHGMHTL